MVNLIVKPSTNEESDPILRLSLFYRHIFEKKKFFCVYRRATYLREKKNSTRRKKIFSPHPNIEEYDLQINQSHRCLEDTKTINISQNTILFSEDFVSYLGNYV